MLPDSLHLHLFALLHFIYFLCIVVLMDIHDVYLTNLSGISLTGFLYFPQLYLFV